MAQEKNTQTILRRTYIVFIGICLFGVAILFQIGRIQIMQGEYWRSKQDSLVLNYINIDASRGNIYSDNGSTIATSRPVYDIRLDMKAAGLTKELFDTNVVALSQKLASLFGDKSAGDYLAMLRAEREEGNRYFLLKREISHNQLLALKNFPIFNMGRNKSGLMEEQKSVRSFPFAPLAARTIGEMRDVKPFGIEESFNKDLSGIGGKRLMQRIGRSTWIPVNDANEFEPKDGNDIYTTIDIHIQDVAENALLQQLQAQNADHGCAILMEVATGEIKAIANLNRNKNGVYEEDLNYALRESAEPGSTMKLASMLALFDDNEEVSLTDSVNVGNGHWYIRSAGDTMNDAHNPIRSTMSVKEIFEHSSNVGVSKLVMQYYKSNPQKFIDKLRSFHLVDRPKLQIGYANNSSLKDRKNKEWWGTTLPWTSVGYEIEVSPLQMLTFYNAVANNGKMVKPKFVREIKSHGQVIQSFPVEVIDSSICSMRALNMAKEMMEGVVLRGSGKTAFKGTPYYVAGKTGTAIIAQARMGANIGNKSYQASFAGYFPADNPRYSCIVVINAPGNGVYYAGAVAAPVFREISDKIIATHLDIAYKSRVEGDNTHIETLPVAKAGRKKELIKTYNKLNIPVEQTENDAAYAKAMITKNKTIAITPIAVAKGTVPDVTGMGLTDAVFILENAGLVVKVSGRGTIVKQSLSAGSKLYRGQTIILELS